ncbi:phage major capsid protein [Desulforhopalus singaporensis]|uniref:Phage major capsid protein, HK97 family n=1 Tax=Desulforhopalus singaporensis TaxID=91360 RepID=A0A1H0VBY7_9BACT|nr:phage major capsid protein [Desulforhopalus singaporensis]SDP75930.1 phage major capsid protein, HK97 family [Desulforhopalus singaporensis]
MKSQKTIETGILYRKASLSAAQAKDDGRLITCSISSDVPYSRWFGREILSHGPGVMNLERVAAGACPFLADHDTTKLIGKVLSVTSDGHRASATIKIGNSQFAEEIYRDIKAGIRTEISIGYTIDEMQLVNEDRTTDEKEYLVNRWTLLHVASVTEPADITVGIGRANDENNHKTVVNYEVTNMGNQDKAVKHSEIIDILAIGKMHGLERESIAAVENGKTLAEFRKQVIAILSQREDAGPLAVGWTSEEIDEVNRNQTRSFSGNSGSRGTPITDAVFAQINELHKSREADRARNIHAELAKKQPGRNNRRGMLVDIGNISTRDLSTNVGTAGGYLVAENLNSNSFIDLLANETVAIKMGAKVLPGLTGDVTVPKQTGSSTAYWVNEGADLTESTPTLGQIRMTPHTVGGYVDITRRMLLQSSIDIENFIRADLARQIGIAIDLASLSGAGASGEPRGVLNTTGVGSVASGAVSLAKMIELVQDLADNNALRGSLGFAMDSGTCGTLCQTPVVDSTDSRMLLDEIPASGEFSRLLGHKLLVSNQLSSKVIFGDWSQLVIGMWSGLDVIVDNTTLGTSGGLRIIAFMDVDIAVRHPEAFSALTVS